GDVLADRALAREAPAGDPDGDRARRDSRLPAPQLLPGADLHGRLGGAPARLPARRDLGPVAPQDGGDRVALLPSARTGRADPGHVVRRREAAQGTPADLRRRPYPSPPPLPEHRLLAAPP